MSVNPGNPIAVHTREYFAACDVFLDGVKVADARVSRGANDSTVAFVDGSLTAVHGPGLYEFRFGEGTTNVVRVSQLVEPWSHEVDPIDVLPELTGTHGWLVLAQERPELPTIELDVDASNNFSRVGFGLAGLVVACNVLSTVLILVLR